MAEKVWESLPKDRPTLLSGVTQLVSDDVLDELDIGMRQLIEEFPQFFRLTAGARGAVAVQPVALPLTEEFVRDVQSILVRNGGKMEADALFREMPEDLRQLVVPHRTLGNALKSVGTEEFVITHKGGMVSLPPHHMHRVAEARRQSLQKVLRDVPSYLVPLPAVAEHEGSTPRDTLARFREHEDMLDLIEPAPYDKRPPLAEISDAYAEDCFVRVLPPFHDACSEASAQLFAEHYVHEFDAYRLARFLTTDVYRPLTELGEAEAILTKPLVQVICGFPELFDFNLAERSVRFILREDMKPMAFPSESDEDLKQRIAKYKDELSARASMNKFDKKALKDKLHRATSALTLRANPAGSVCMDKNVLAMLIYDVLPETGAIGTDRVNELLPEFARGTTIRLTRDFFAAFPHLFTVFQVKPPRYDVQRADIPLDDSVASRTEDGRPFAELTAAEAAEFVIDTVIKVQFEYDRPTRQPTVMTRLPYLFRKRLHALGWDAVCDARPDELVRVRVGNEQQPWLLFRGDRLKQVLPPNSKGPMKLKVVFVETGEEWVAPALPEPTADDTTPTQPTVTTADVQRSTRGWGASDTAATDGAQAGELPLKAPSNRGWVTPDGR